MFFKFVLNTLFGITFLLKKNPKFDKDNVNFYADGILFYSCPVTDQNV